MAVTLNSTYISGISDPYCAYVKNTSNTTLSLTTWTKVPFETQLWTSGSVFSNGTFTPGVAGYYNVNVGVTLTRSGVMWLEAFAIRKNGSDINNQEMKTNLYYTWIGFNYNGLIYLSATDYIEAWVYTTGTNVNIYRTDNANGFGAGTYFNAILYTRG